MGAFLKWCIRPGRYQWKLRCSLKIIWGPGKYFEYLMRETRMKHLVLAGVLCSTFFVSTSQKNQATKDPDKPGRKRKIFFYEIYFRHGLLSSSESEIFSLVTIDYHHQSLVSRSENWQSRSQVSNCKDKTFKKQILKKSTSCKNATCLQSIVIWIGVGVSYLDDQLQIVVKCSVWSLDADLSLICENTRDQRLESEHNLQTVVNIQ